MQGLARGSPGVPMTPGRPSFEQTTYNIQVAKTPWQHLGGKSLCRKAHIFKICFFVKHFRQWFLSLVNVGLHPAIIQAWAWLIHEGEQRYKAAIRVKVDMTIWWVASVTARLKNPGYAPVVQFQRVKKGKYLHLVLRQCYQHISQQNLYQALQNKVHKTAQSLQTPWQYQA